MIGCHSFRKCNFFRVERCERLQVLSIGDHSLTGPVTSESSVLSHLPSLKWFSVGEESVSGVEQILVDGWGWSIVCYVDVADVSSQCIRLNETSFHSLKIVDGNTQLSLYSALHCKLSNVV